MSPKPVVLKRKRNAKSPPRKVPEYDYPHDIYESGDDGFPRHEIDWDNFYAELVDLLGRYGGVDTDHSFRLTARVTDVLTNYDSAFMDVPKLTKEMSDDDVMHSLSLAETNIHIGVKQLEWVMNDLRRRQKGHL